MPLRSQASAHYVMRRFTTGPIVDASLTHALIAQSQRHAYMSEVMRPNWDVGVKGG